MKWLLCGLVKSCEGGLGTEATRIGVEVDGPANVFVIIVVL